MISHWEFYSPSKWEGLEAIRKKGLPRTPSFKHGLLQASFKSLMEGGQEAGYDPTGTLQRQSLQNEPPSWCHACNHSMYTTTTQEEGTTVGSPQLLYYKFLLLQTEGLTWECRKHSGYTGNTWLTAAVGTLAQTPRSRQTKIHPRSSC